jgi:leucyl aminopeptidase
MINFTIYNNKKNTLFSLDPDNLTPDSIDKIISYIHTHANLTPININFDNIDETTIDLFIYNLVNSFYSYKHFIKKSIEKVYINGITILKYTKYRLFLNILESRYLNDTPSNIANSYNISNYIINRLKQYSNISIEVYDKDRLKLEGFGGILAINSGSANEPRLLVITYKTDSSNPIVIIGKGVVFDAGGLNLKRGDFSDMKLDKTGAIYTYTLIKSLCENKVNGHFIGFLPLVENVISSGSYKPGDVISLYDKTTVELADLDAEGRIILADCLGYVKKNLEPKLIIDIATLTGQAAYFFGNIGTAIMYNKSSKKYIKKLISIGDKNLQFFWKIRLHNIYKKYLDSDVADLVNYNKKNSASVIFSGLFLNHFVHKNTPWIHFDIAGSAIDKNSTGEPLYSLYQFLLYVSEL